VIVSSALTAFRKSAVLLVSIFLLWTSCALKRKQFTAEDPDVRDATRCSYFLYPCFHVLRIFLQQWPLCHWLRILFYVYYPLLPYLDTLDIWILRPAGIALAAR